MLFKLDVYVTGGGTLPPMQAAFAPHQAPPIEMLPISATAEISFYQSALRSAEREAAQLQAQRHTLEQADRAVALLVQQAPPTVMRPSPATAANG